MLTISLIDDDGVLANTIGSEVPDGEVVTLIGTLKTPRNVLCERPGSWVVRNATNQQITVLPPDFEHEDSRAVFPVGRMRTVNVRMDHIEVSAPPEPPVKPLVPAQAEPSQQDDAKDGQPE